MCENSGAESSEPDILLCLHCEWSKYEPVNQILVQLQPSLPPLPMVWESHYKNSKSSIRAGVLFKPPFPCVLKHYHFFKKNVAGTGDGKQVCNCTGTDQSVLRTMGFWLHLASLACPELDPRGKAAGLNGIRWMNFYSSPTLLKWHGSYIHPGKRMERTLGRERGMQFQELESCMRSYGEMRTCEIRVIWGLVAVFLSLKRSFLRPVGRSLAVNKAQMLFSWGTSIHFSGSSWE